MRGISSQPPFRVRAARRFIASPTLLLVCISTLTGIASGCASVSADKSLAEHAATKISIVPSVIDFKSVVVGQKNSQTIKLTNSGTDGINLDHLRVSGNGFSLSSGKAPLLLPPGKHVNLTVVFAPSSAAAVSGSLVISSSDLKAPIAVPLTGSGEKPAPALTVSPTSINFGVQAVKSSTAQSVTLTNTGNISLTLSSISVSNPSFSVSGLSNGVSLSPDQKLEFKVWFHPSVTGSSSSTISVEVSSLRAPLKIALSGSATSSAPAPGATPPHSVSLDWNPSSSKVAGYHVYRGNASGGPFNRISTSLVKSLNYQDTAVQPGGHYFYVVTAVGTGNSESSYSNEVAADVPIP